MGYTARNPVCLFIYRRSDTVQRIMKAISDVKPKTLMLIADGPQSDDPNERVLCSHARALAMQVDWPCEVFTNFSHVNLGNTVRFSSGLDWVFARHEQAIILEDDNLPSPDFFRFCDELLDQYATDERVMMIGGSNFLPASINIPDSYYFTKIPNIWGWATWRRAWKHYDYSASLWPGFCDSGQLETYFQDSDSIRFWRRFMESSCSMGNRQSFEGRWIFTIMARNGLAVVPSSNLISNIGFCDGGISGRTRHPWADWPHQTMTFPLRHPHIFLPNTQADYYYQKVGYEQLPPDIIARMGPLNKA